MTKQNPVIIPMSSSSGKVQYEDLLDLAAHDLQAPLRKLSVLTDRLISKFVTSEPSEANEYVQRMNTCIRDMQSLVNSIIELGNVSTEAMQVVACDLNSILKQQTHALGPVLRKDDTVIDSNNLEVVEGDPGQLGLLFRKIIENSIKFCKEGEGLKIEIKGRDATENEKMKFGVPVSSGYYTIQVSDNGIGFDNENADKIFQPLVRLHGKSAYPGNGLGLAICEKIASNHHGFIYGERMDNNGARFTIILPKKQLN